MCVSNDGRTVATCVLSGAVMSVMRVRAVREADTVTAPLEASCRHHGGPLSDTIQTCAISSLTYAPPSFPPSPLPPFPPSLFPTGLVDRQLPTALLDTLRARAAFHFLLWGVRAAEEMKGD